MKKEGRESVFEENANRGRKAWVRRVWNADTQKGDLKILSENKAEIKWFLNWGWRLQRWKWESGNRCPKHIWGTDGTLLNAFNGNTGGEFNEEEPEPMYAEEAHVPPLGQDNMRPAIRWLKNNKAPGAHGTPTVLFKAGEEELLSRICSVEYMPEDWNLSRLCPIHMNGDVAVFAPIIAKQVLISLTRSRRRYCVKAERASWTNWLDLISVASVRVRHWLDFHSTSNPGEDTS